LEHKSLTSVADRDKGASRACLQREWHAQEIQSALLQRRR
jgi:hypothetical protein